MTIYVQANSHHSEVKQLGISNMAGAAPLSYSLLRPPSRPPATALLPGKASTLSRPRFSTAILRASSAADESAASVIKGFFDGINRRDLTYVEGLIAEDCVYEDLIFSHAFVGRQEIMELFEKFTAYISTDLQLIIADITNGDSHCVGVTWHLEWKGKPLRNSKGCSFYRLVERDQKRQIVYGRDVVEPTIKSGKAVLVVIKGVTWLLQRFPHLADL